MLAAARGLLLSLYFCSKVAWPLVQHAGRHAEQRAGPTERLHPGALPALHAALTCGAERSGVVVPMSRDVQRKLVQNL